MIRLRAGEYIPPSVLNFEKDSLVFHPHHGHCRVMGQREEVLLRIPTQILELETLDKAVIFRLPLSGTVHATLRPLESKEAILKKLELLKEPAQMGELEETDRLQAQKEILSKGTFEGLVSLFRDLHKLQKTANFGTPEKKAMDQAKAWVLQEMMLVLGITKLEARKMVEDAVKQQPKVKAKKA